LPDTAPTFTPPVYTHAHNPRPINVFHDPDGLGTHVPIFATDIDAPLQRNPTATPDVDFDHHHQFTGIANPLYNLDAASDFNLPLSNGGRPPRPTPADSILDLSLDPAVDERPLSPMLLRNPNTASLDDLTSALLHSDVDVGSMGTKRQSFSQLVEALDMSFDGQTQREPIRKQTPTIDDAENDPLRNPNLGDTLDTADTITVEVDVHQEENQRTRTQDSTSSSDSSWRDPDHVHDYQTPDRGHFNGLQERRQRIQDREVNNNEPDTKSPSPTPAPRNSAPTSAPRTILPTPAPRSRLSQIRRLQKTYTKSLDDLSPRIRPLLAAIPPETATFREHNWYDRQGRVRARTNQITIQKAPKELSYWRRRQWRNERDKALKQQLRETQTPDQFFADKGSNRNTYWIIGGVVASAIFLPTAIAPIAMADKYHWQNLENQDKNFNRTLELDEARYNRTKLDLEARYNQTKLDQEFYYNRSRADLLRDREEARSRYPKSPYVHPSQYPRGKPLPPSSKYTPQSSLAGKTFVLPKNYTFHPEDLDFIASLILAKAMKHNLTHLFHLPSDGGPPRPEVTVIKDNIDYANDPIFPTQTDPHDPPRMPPSNARQVADEITSMILQQHQNMELEDQPRVGRQLNKKAKIALASMAAVGTSGIPAAVSVYDALKKHNVIIGKVLLSTSILNRIEIVSS